MADATEVIDQAEPQPEAETSFKEFTDARRAGKIDATKDGDAVAPGGNVFDKKTNEWVNATRDDKGRFAKVRESLERSQKRSAFVKGVLEGTIEADDSTMDADTWAAARNAQIARGTNKITPPDFPDEKKPADGPKAESDEQELTPEETQHIEQHDSFMSSIAAKSAIDKETETALQGFGAALDRGVEPDVLKFAGHVISDLPNAHEVFVTLGKNPAALERYATLPPQGLKSAIEELGRQISAQKTAAQVKPAETKPKPPSPVGGRASSAAFDPYDDATPADEWARQRNEQLAKKGSRRW